MLNYIFGKTYCVSIVLYKIFLKICLPCNIFPDDKYSIILKIIYYCDILVLTYVNEEQEHY